jgi:hypothetical protein
VSKQWLLIVYDGRGKDHRLHRMGMRPSTKKAGQYVGFYSLGAKVQLLRHIDELKSMGLRGIARQIEAREPVRSKQWPRHKTPAGPSAEIISIQIAAENRIARDALKLAREHRRQAEQLAEREANQQAKRAIQRAKGDA